MLQGDAEFELECVRAYNDGLAEWAQVSDRYVPLALIPYLSGVEAAAAEVERECARKAGDAFLGGGIVALAHVPEAGFG